MATDREPATGTVDGGRRSAGEGRRTPRWRRALVAVLVVLTCLCTLVSSVSIWAHRTVFDTDRWVATVGPLAQDDAVITSVSAHLTGELTTAIQPEQAARRLLPPTLQGLAGPVGQGVDQLIGATVSRVLRSDQFQQFWVAANRALQPKVAAILQGKPTSHLVSSSGEVQLNLLPLVSKGLRGVQSRAPGLLRTDGPIPVVTSTTPVDQARTELGQALGRDLPAGFGTLTLFRSDQLAAAQHLVSLFDTLIVALVVVTAALAVVTLVVAERRRRALIALALGVVVAMGLAYALTKVLTNQLAAAITDPDDRGAVRATMRAVVGGLDVISAVLIGIGLVVAVVGFLAGPSRLASSLRHQGSVAGRSLVGRAEGSPSPLLSWVRRQRMPLALAGAGVAVLLLVVVVEGWIGLLVVALALAAYEGLVAWLARSAAIP